MFRDQAHHLDGKVYENQEKIEHDLTIYFESQNKGIWRKGCHSLAERWQRVTDNDDVHC